MLKSSADGGDPLQGYGRMPMLQAQMTATQLFDQVMGASRLTVIGEVGYNRINRLGDSDGSDLRFGRSTISVPANCRPAKVSAPRDHKPAPDRRARYPARRPGKRD